MKTWLASIAAAIFAFLGAFLYGKRAGKQEQENKQKKEILDDVKKAKEASDYSDSLTDKQRRDELLKYVRKQ